MRRILMAMLVVGLLAAGAQATMTLSLSAVTSPSTGLSSVIVTANASGDDTIVVTLEGIIITGDVHNITGKYGPESHEIDDIDTTAGLWDTSYNQYDTHSLISASSDVELTIGTGYAETNDQGNPTSLVVVAPPDALMPYIGEGTFGMSSANDVIGLNEGAQAASVDFLQVVWVTASGVPTLDAELIGDEIEKYTFDDFPIPEPTTLLILLGGGLVGLIRRR